MDRQTLIEAVEILVEQRGAYSEAVIVDTVIEVLREHGMSIVGLTRVGFLETAYSPPNKHTASAYPPIRKEPSKDSWAKAQAALYVVTEPNDTDPGVLEYFGEWCEPVIIAPGVLLDGASPLETSPMTASSQSS